MDFVTNLVPLTKHYDISVNMKAKKSTCSWSVQAPLKIYYAVISYNRWINNVPASLGAESSVDYFVKNKLPLLKSCFGQTGRRVVGILLIIRWYVDWQQRQTECCFIRMWTNEKIVISVYTNIQYTALQI